MYWLLTGTSSWNILSTITALKGTIKRMPFHFAPSCCKEKKMQQKWVLHFISLFTVCYYIIWWNEVPSGCSTGWEQAIYLLIWKLTLLTTDNYRVNYIFIFINIGNQRAFHFIFSYISWPTMGCIMHQGQILGQKADLVTSANLPSKFSAEQ